MKYRKIGTWNRDNGNSSLQLIPTVAPLQERKEENPGSSSSTQCLPSCVLPDRPVRLARDGEFLDDCCHSCHRLDPNEIFTGGRNEPCLAGSWPNHNQTECELINKDEILPNYDRTSTPVLTVDFFSFLFLLIILAFSVLFFIRRTDPIVGKSGN